MRLKDLSGKKFNKLRVLQRVAATRQGSSTWLCKCDCGNEVIVSSDHLTRKSYPVKSCGCSRIRRGSNSACWNGCGEISGNWWYNHVLRERNNKIRARVPVEVTKEFAWNLFLKQNRKCALSGLEIRIGNTGSDNTASIDRINSSLGYVEGNIQWVHKVINFMKRTYSQEYFIKMCTLVAKNCGEIT